MTSTTAADTTPVNWVFAPDCSATAVREPLVLIGNPWKNPASTFAAPIPTKLLIGVYLQPLARSEPRRGGDRIANGDQRDAECRGDENRQVAKRKRVATVARGSPVAGSHDRDVMGRQIEE